MDKLPTLGETPEHAWMLEFLDRCFPESGGHVNADLQLAMAMCKAEPKCAQVTMQMLAQNVRDRNPDDDGVTFQRFALGVLFTAYAGLAQAERRCAEGGLPPELDTAVRWNPEILECANELGPMQLDDE